MYLNGEVNKHEQYEHNLINRTFQKALKSMLPNEVAV